MALALRTATRLQDQDDVNVTPGPAVDGYSIVWDNVAGEFGAAMRASSATRTVAAVDSSITSRSRADYVCDGVADDVQIQAALAALPAAGGRVVLLEGTFTLAATVLIPSNVHVQGQGQSTTVTLVNNANVHVFANSDQAGGNTDIRLSDMFINGNRSGQTNGLAANSIHAVWMVAVTGLTLENIHTYELIDDGYKLKDCVNLYVVNCSIDGAGTEGWSIDNCSWGRFVNVHAVNVDGLDANGVDVRPGGASAWGFEVEDGSNHLQFANVTAKDCTQAGGWHTQSHGALFCSYITVANILVTGCPGIGIQISGMDGPLAIDNLQTFGAATGVYISSLYGIQISNFHVSAATGLHIYGNTDQASFANGNIIATGRAIMTAAGLVTAEFEFDNVYCESASTTTSVAQFNSACTLRYVGGAIVATGNAAAAYAVEITSTQNQATFYGTRLHSVYSRAVQIATNVNNIELIGCQYSSDAEANIVNVNGTNQRIRFIGGTVIGKMTTAVYGILMGGTSEILMDGVTFNFSASAAGYCSTAFTGTVIQNCIFNGGRYGIVSAQAGSLVQGCIFSGQPANSAFRAAGINAAARIHNNIGYVTESDGEATVANGTTSIVVNHGLSRTPTLTDIKVTPTNNLGNATKFWISTPTATQFTINVDADPGAGTATFVWSAMVI